MRSGSFRFLLYTVAFALAFTFAAPVIGESTAQAFNREAGTRGGIVLANGFNGHRWHLHRPYYNREYRPYRSYYFSRPFYTPYFRGTYYERYYPYYYTPYPLFVPGFSFYFGY